MLTAVALTALSAAQESAAPVAGNENHDESAQLREQLQAQDARIRELERKLGELSAKQEASGTAAAEPSPPTPAPAPVEHEHTMQLPGGGPALKIRGFADFNLGFGSVANPLIFPLPAPVHNTFQIGELDLFLSSRLSSKVSFLSELIFGTDASNEWGIDVERMQITYKVNPYFQISGGRYHTSIGYYNTAFHHGTWFQTATGRPFMYYFEDSGGILPVHGVGVTATGLVPGASRLGLHWIAEVSNGRAADPNAAQVQNFLADRNHKAFNLAGFITPGAIPGLQLGGSFYRDRLNPPGQAEVDQSIGSLYAVYLNGPWEYLGEAVLVSNHQDAISKTFHSPLTYVQLAHKFGPWRPYGRFQYVNVPALDPINVFKGRYEGPSFGVRMDFTEYAALKVQYNRIYQRIVPAENGVDMQVAFTF
jgi:hypothetical protein